MGDGRRRRNYAVSLRIYWPSTILLYATQVGTSERMQRCSGCCFTFVVFAAVALLTLSCLNGCAAVAIYQLQAPSSRKSNVVFSRRSVVSEILTTTIATLS